jgi:hypothetical protein
MEIRKAQKQKAKLRIGLSGPSGSGKTYSALLLASGLADWDKICVIDSENGSAELYDSLGEYSVIPLLAPFTPERYIEAIQTAEDAGMEVVVLDSITHEWDGVGGCLEINDDLASTPRFRGNSYMAWNETGKRHQAFIYAVIQSKCHIITTVRNKVEYAITESNGRKAVQKVGTKEITRDGFEYELTTNFTLDRERNLAYASKDRTGLFTKRDPFLITQEIGKEFKDWAENGIEAPKQKTIDEVVADIEVCDNFKHLRNIFLKYKHVFEGEDRDKLVKAKDDAKARLDKTDNDK